MEIKDIKNLEDELYSYIKSDKATQENFYKFLLSLNLDESVDKIIHVVGTNGKGSTLSYVEQGLLEQGFKTMKYTSPHLVSFNERIKLNNINISYENIKLYLDRIIELKGRLGIELSFFQIMTAIAYAFGKDNNVDYFLFEAGIGAQYDSCNVFKKPVATIITNVSLDHTAMLGPTINDIAKTKAYCLKQNCNAFIIEQDKEVMNVFKNVATENNSKLNIVKPLSINNNAVSIFRHDHKIKSLYDSKNIALAIEILKHLNISEDNICKAIKNCFWPGRMQHIKNTNIIIDGAHNIDGIDNFIEYTKNNVNNIKVVYGGLAKKDHSAFIDLLIKNNYQLILTSIPNNDSFDNSKYIGTKNVVINNNLNEVIDIIKKEIQTTYIIGSLYLVGECLKILT